MILNYYNDLVFQPSELFLNKDFGQVATVLGSIHGQTVTHLISCNNPNELLQTFSGNAVVQAKKLFRSLPRNLDFLKNLAAYYFLFRHRARFTVLVIFPFCPPSDLLIVRLFRAFNPRGRVILKLDANLSHLKGLQASYEAAPRSLFRQHRYYRRLLEIADIVMYESRDVGRLLTQTSFLGTRADAKFVNVFNGLSATSMTANLGTFSRAQPRENVIIVSGRLSSPQKNVELILRADPVPAGWRIKFIGAVDEAFQRIIASYRDSDPDFDRKYEFVGEIRDKPTYFRELSSGRVLLLTSIWEGFPMVYAEAHYFGLYIITTDVSGAAEATDGGRLGTIIPRNDPSSLRAAVHEVCANGALQRNMDEVRRYGASHFIWEDSLRTPAIDRLFACLPPCESVS